MRILVTGATGFIGSAVVARLLASGHSVVGAVHRPESARAVEAVGATAVVTDLTTTADVAPLTADVDAVLQLATFARPDFPEIDRRSAVRLMSTLQPGQLFTYTSGAAVVGDTGIGVADEDVEPAAASVAAWRAYTERAVLAAARPGVRASVIRPAVIVYGRPDKGLVGQLLEQARSTGVVQVIEGGTARISTVHVDDLADVYGRVVDTPTASGVFLGASDEVVQLMDVASAIADATGARVANTTLEQARSQMGMLAALLSTNTVVVATRSRGLLHWAPQHRPLLDDLKTRVAWTRT